MSQNIIWVGISFNALMVLASVADSKWGWVWYWGGALMINVGVLVNLRGPS